jgi:hypothetical protein
MRWLFSVLLCLMVQHTIAHANDAEFKDIKVEWNADNEAWELSGDVQFELPRRLEEALHNGVSLYFVTEVELAKPRQFWFDEKASINQQYYRLSWHAITRQYGIATGSLTQRFSSLSDALRFLKRIRRIKVADRTQVKLNETYQLSARFKLDSSQLPRPYQLNFQFNPAATKDWTVISEWKKLTFVTTINSPINSSAAITIGE